MKLASFICAIALASGAPLVAHAWGMGGGAAAGMHTATAMTNFATGIASSVINAGTGNIAGGAGNVSGSMPEGVGKIAGAGGAENDRITAQSATVATPTEITLSNITFPALFGLSLPEINIPEIHFPMITIPKTISHTSSNSQQSRSDNSVRQITENNTIIQQQSNVPGTSSVMVGNQIIQQNKQISVP